MAAPANNSSANKSSGVGARLITASLLIGAFLAGLYVMPPLVWIIGIALLIGSAAFEWARLNSLASLGAGSYALANIGIALLALFFHLHLSWALYLAPSLFWLAVAPLWLWHGWQRPPNLPALALGSLLIVPTGLGMIALQASAPNFLFAIVALVALADSAAFFFGRRYGKHKLAPTISPGKTREGFWGAAGTVMLFALAVTSAQIPGLPPAALWLSFAGLAFLLSVLGDLFESWFKRQAGVKDSGTWLPGHGGLLDRVDGLLAVLPPALLFWPPGS